jgi:hypothetical protein
MRNISLVSLFALVPLAGLGQARSNAPIIAGPTGAGKITGLTSTITPNALLNLDTELQGGLRYGAPTDGEVWDIDLASLPNGSGPGTALLVKPPTGSTGKVLLRVNGSGPHAVLYAPEDTLEAQEIPPGATLYVVFDGGAYRVLNGDQHLRRSCPSGTADMGGQVCIEVGERSASGFADAVLTCADLNARLCSWGELSTGCLRRVELGLLNMTNNLEWTSNPANEDGSVRVALGSTCQQAGATPTSSIHTFRCCSTR